MNKKKICIIISSIVVFTIITCVALYLYSKNSQKLESSTFLGDEEIQNEIVQEEIIENTTDVETPEVQEEKSEPNDNENQKEINTPIIQEEKETSRPVTASSSKVNEEKTNTKSIEQKQKTIQTETKKDETPKQVENTTTATNIETPKKEEIKEDPKPAQSTTNTNTEKYVKNDAMISKIKSVIQNNESDFMKQYGYNIIVDSSIKEQTNQFTYTENRVKSYITYKFGTIRIYAEDYYKNGNLIMTECYIL